MKIEITDKQQIRSLYRCVLLLKNSVLKSMSPPIIDNIIHEIETSHPDIMDQEIEEFGR